MSKKVLITGIAGLIGSHLAKALVLRGYTVYGVDSLICGDAINIPTDVHYWVKMDCRDNERLAAEMERLKPDIVVHCAATAAEGLSVFSPSFITKNIYEASVSVFSAAIAAGAKRIVHFSSMARYGKGSTYADNHADVEYLSPPFTEDRHITAPLDPYGIAKVAAEETLRVLCETHGIKWSICVPHNVIGPRQQVSAYRNVATIFLNRLRMDEKVYIYGDGEQKRCFSPIKDCLHSLVKIVEGEADGEVVNIGPDGGEITINSLLKMCEEVTGCKADVEYLPPRPVTDTVTEAHCSSDKARRLLGYEPQQSLRDCLVEMNQALVPKKIEYNYPLEIDSPLCPRTWREKL